MPQTRMRDATNTLRTITRIRMRDETNTLRTIQRIRMRDETNTLRTVYQYLSASNDVPYVFGLNGGAALHGSVTSDPVTTTVSGGTGPFTYSWEYVSGNLGMAPDTPTANSTTFTGDVNNADTLHSEYRCLITDANGATTYSPNVIVELQWYDTR